MSEKSIFEMVMPDPVLSVFELPLSARFYPFGYPLDLRTNSAHVIQAATEGWGPFPQQFDAAPVRLELGVLPGNSTELPSQSVFRSRDHLMFAVADTENFVVCDFNQSFAFGWVNETTAADHPLLRHRFLTSAGLTLIEQKACASLHCGLVERNGCGVALLGDTFTGKSTLSYACARSGWTFVSDDGVQLVRDRSDRYAVGDPHTIRFREDAPSLFPELSHRSSITRPNGKVALEILTRDFPIATAPGASIGHVVFLNRVQSGPARIRQHSRDEAMQWCERYSTFGTRQTREAQRRCYQRLVSAGIWQMTYSDLDSAIERLARLVDSGG